MDLIPIPPQNTVPSPPIRTFTHISISTNQKDHLAAARALSSHLDEWGIRHTYIGGLAWSLLGSDIDVLIEDHDLLGLREKLTQLDARFADVGIRLYFVTQAHDGQLVREALVRSSVNNVLVETLRTGSLGLPTSIRHTYATGEPGIHILHPTILVLTKFQRWCATRTSTRPRTVQKNAVDRRDIHFAINWLADNGERIDFDQYVGKTKQQLLALIRTYHDTFVDDEEHMASLRSIMPDEWDEMLTPPGLPEESNVLP